MSILLIAIILCFTLNSPSEANKHEKKLPSAVVVGTVYCDSCFQDESSMATHFISGASVAVECLGSTTSSPSFREEVKTDEHGEFRISLPFSVGKHVKRIKRCSVKLINSSEPYCAVASTATSSSLHLKSRTRKTHIFSAGFFTFKPLNQPLVCSQKPSLQKDQNSNKFSAKKSSLPTPNDPTFPTPFVPPVNHLFLPPLPQLPTLPPLPRLPPLPPLPGIPQFPPLPEKKTTQEGQQEFFQPIPQLPQFPSPQPPFGIPFPPNPFQPSPSILPPNPFQQPPSLLPPNPFQPSPPAPTVNLPPLPFFAQPPPPLPPPSPRPFQLPPFPFQPSPGFPGTPPTSP